MEVTFRREDNKNYLKISFVEQEHLSEYPVKMLSNNNIPGLLNIQERIIDNKTEYYYDIKTYKSVVTLYEKHDMKVPEAVKILQCLDRSIRGLDEYFLERDKILLNPRCIMIDTEADKAYFAYIPGKKEMFESELRKLIEFMLEHMEHSDRNMTIRFYEVYQNVIRGKSDIGEIIERLADNNSNTFSNDCEETKEYTVPDVISEHIEQEEEKVIFNPKKAALIIRSAAALSVAAAVLSQIFSDSLPVNIPLNAALLIGIASIAVYMLGTKLETLPASVFTKMVTKDEEIPYSFSKSEYEVGSQPDKLSETGENSRHDECNKSNMTMILSDAVKQKCIIELVVNDGNTGVNICIESLPCILGSSPESADIMVEQPFISRIHAKIDMENDGTYFIQDMFSTNGTFVNGQRLPPESRCPLNDGDIIVLASSSYSVSI